jgi:hypothetical protein
MTARLLGVLLVVVHLLLLHRVDERLPLQPGTLAAPCCSIAKGLVFEVNRSPRRARDR